MEKNTIDEHLLKWKKQDWLARKRKETGCIWVECALLEHEDKTKVYLAPEPDRWSIIFEVDRAELVNVLPTGKVMKYLGNSFSIVRVFIKEETTLIQLRTTFAWEVPGLFQELNAPPERDTMLKAHESGHEGGGGGDHPRPEPSERPRERPRGGGGGVSGVRG